MKRIASDRRPHAVKGIPLALLVVMTVLVAVNLSHVWRVKELPFTDLPFHLAEAVILKLTWLHDQTIASYYSVADNLLIIPNIGHAVFCALFDDVEFGNRIAYSLYMILLPSLALALIRLVKGNYWFALLAIPLIYNYNTMWGFTGFTLAIPLALAIFLLSCSYIRNPTALKAGLLFAGSFAVYYTHALVFLFMVPLCVLSSLVVMRGSYYWRLIHLLSFSPAVLVLLFWVWTGSEFDREQSLWSFLASYYWSEYLPSIAGRFSDFFLNDNTWVAWGTWGRSIALIYSLSVVVPVALYLHPDSISQLFATQERCVAALFVGFAALCYAGLPDRLPEEPILFERFSVFIYIGVICCGSFIVPTKWRRQAAVAATVIATVFSLLSFHYFSGFRDWVSGIPWVLKGQDSDRTLAAIIDDQNYRGRPAIVHYNNYHIVWNNGITATELGEFRFGMVNRKASTKDLPEYVDWIWKDTDLEELISRYSGMDLLLTHGTEPFDMLSVSDEWRLIRSRNNWALFEKVLPGDSRMRPSSRIQ
jgi:hypothetical protein